MGTPWCAALPVVAIPQTATPKPVTFIYPYYQNPQFLRRQIGWWDTYPRHVRAQLQALIVDDASPVPAVLPDRWPFDLRLFRLEQDVRWNWLAARNIGFCHAPDGWCLVTDMDHVVPASTAEQLVYGQHDPGVIYGFSRIEADGTVLTPHPNSWFLTRRLFWEVGGYDETLSGYYGTDGDWRRRCAQVAPIQILRERLIRHEYDGDASTTAYLRKQPEDARVKTLVAQRGKGWRPRTLTFAYHEVTVHGDSAPASHAPGAAPVSSGSPGESQPAPDESDTGAHT